MAGATQILNSPFVHRVEPHAQSFKRGRIEMPGSRGVFG
jgi:hypothetical protein